MQKEFYYLVATLPYQEFKKGSGMTKEEILYEYGKWLDERELSVLAAAKLECDDSEPRGAQVLEEWSEFNRDLRIRISDIRKTKERIASNRAKEDIKEIFNQQDPLLTEMAFEKKRWDFLDQRMGGYFFDMNYLIIYFLKAQILERINKFDKDAGESYFNELCEVKNEEEIGKNNID